VVYRTQPCHCGEPDTRPYAEGWRCPAHTPSARAGLPEPDSARYCAPLRCYCGQHDSYDRPLDPVTDTIVDARAVASGKRRSTPAEYRAAQAAVRKDSG
jgi:hypothetical protein